MKWLSDQHGDTIVEVLIAIIVVSSILTGVYLVAHNSLIQDRQAQERSEGLKLVEGQVEALRASAAQANSPIFTQTSVFCMDTINNNQPILIYAGAPSAGNMTPIGSDQASFYPNPGPGVCSSQTDTIGTSDIVFNLSIDPCSPAVAGNPDCGSNIGISNPIGPQVTAQTPNLFIVRARWDSATGKGRQEAKLLYRIYPLGLAATAN